MTRSTIVRCDGCGRPMLGGPIVGVGAMAVRARADSGQDPGWHDLDGGRDVCPQCWEGGIR